MKKLIITFLLLLGVLIFFGFAKGQNNDESFSSINKDEIDPNESENKKVTTIDEIDHLVEVKFAPNGIFSLDEMINSLDTEVYSEDRVEAFPDPKFGIGSKITITRATPVKVIDAGDEEVYRTWKTNVSDLFNEVGIEVGDKDRINIGLDQNLRFELEIEITRISSGDDYEYEEIDFKTITKKDLTLERGVTKVSQAGKVGKKKLIYTVVEENGIEISRKLSDTEVVREPQDKIVLEGTKVVSYGSGTATWYSLIGGMTAASNSLPYGTKVLVRASNGREVEVKIVDHGIQGGAIIDLSDEAFAKLAPLGAGRISVTLEKP
jgi:hypothetical protein